MNFFKMMLSLSSNQFRAHQKRVMEEVERKARENRINKEQSASMQSHLIIEEYREPDHKSEMDKFLERKKNKEPFYKNISNNKKPWE